MVREPGKEPNMAKKMNQNQNQEVKVITMELIEAARKEGRKVQMGKKGTKMDGFVKIDMEAYKIVENMPESEPEKESEKEEKPKQVHESRDRDIKIESGKVDGIGVKIIYHRDSKGEKQYQIWLSQKVMGKLIRQRYKADAFKEIERDEKKALEYYHQIIDKKIKVEIRVA